MSRGLTAEGVEALDDALARRADRGDLPGLVALVARGDDVHVAAIGHGAFGDAEPIGPRRHLPHRVGQHADFWAAAYAAIDG